MKTFWCGVVWVRRHGHRVPLQWIQHLDRGDGVSRCGVAVLQDTKPGVRPGQGHRRKCQVCFRSEEP